VDIKGYRITHYDLVNMVSGIQPPHVEAAVFESQHLGETIKLRKNKEIFLWDRPQLLKETDEKLLSLYNHLKMIDYLGENSNEIRKRN
jgi:hypothetical protein